MRKLVSVFCAVAVMAAASTASAADFSPLFPGTFVGSFDHHKEAAPAPVAESKAIELFECVKYEDLDHIAPCAETKIVKVLDPCWKPDPCKCACDQKPKCVYVKICVPKKQPCHTCCAPKPSCCAPKPACGCQKDHGPKVTCKKNGAYTKYDYGKYRVEIRVKNGWVVVDYDD
ncbi:MAG: hypothetical protein ACI8P0_001760 [Planctomycetaceae bacterium]|jgi:hypothetical protein